MKKSNVFVAAGALALVAVMTACGGKKSEEKAAAAEPSEATATATTPVKANAITEKTVNLNGQDQAYTLVERIYQADDNAMFYLSVSALVPSDQSPVTGSLSGVVDEAYALLNAPSVEAIPVDSPESLAAHIDSLGTAFVAFATPMAADDSEFATPGYMMSVSLTPVYATDNAVTYNIVTDVFTGGNAPDYNEVSASFNPETGVMYQFDDLVSADKQAAVKQQLVETIAAANDKSVEEYLADMALFLNADDLTVETFPVYYVAETADGLLFTYPKYSIAAGSEGCPHYVIAVAE